LPERYGKWNSVYRFHLRWSKRGVFQELLDITAQLKNDDEFKVVDGSHIKVHQDACYTCKGSKDQKFGKTKGGRNSKLHAVTNRKGKLLNFLLLPGQESEMKSVLEVLGDVRNRIVLGDKGYDSDSLREHIEVQGGVALIPPRKHRKDKVFYVKEIGRERHVVENYFARLKRYRRTGTRYDRLPETFISFICLASIMDWLR